MAERTSPRRNRRRRRPLIIGVVLAFFGVVLWEVIASAIDVSHQPGLGPTARFFLGTAFPVVAVAAGSAPLFHVPTMLTGRRLPGWVMSFVVAPCYIFILACVAHAVGASVSESFRWVANLGPASVPMQEIGLALPFALAFYGTINGTLRVGTEELESVLVGLGAGLSGLRVVQLSDLHAGGLVGEARLRRIAAKVERLKPDLVVVTGDIVNANPAEAELVGPILGAIHAPLGVWACMGNHDHFVDGEAVAAILTRSGVGVLRNEGTVIERGGASLWLAGVDDTWTHQADLEKALRHKPEGMPTLLLAHDPDFWPKAIERKVEMTLSGHTHGGQIGLVKLHPSISLARLVTPFVAGMYERGGTRLYVSRGTASSLPLRLGAPAEVCLHLLMAEPALS